VPTYHKVLIVTDAAIDIAGPVILTSRADSLRARIASCAVAVLAAHARRPPLP
jgi:hypothetical protein